ncbi:fatty acid/phospholipid synthesis protein PlsX [Ehrlichia chaffeensis str. Heartland]|uniref:Phosphate acyltransferase n=1 Tax=Ehrlichia chaffeensis (strain ATCC CRL-10679 / Arkansas) TaxID=205920 RepID=PLSX_EHRCR|nr:phosphate acyltransferase PlsX [Ehrlichia chaffeensis]Q2GH18.1 RecName: Full=Phosphate acyltransferase; AltName: Full=Acyl-ACP phosphotransacylase; AltName: Full=Acyl-[acyl-carrier-protein]--phosphate acyltransferase; AltName: Full=Phosphate-acyl-ACP acyltransferase [Ehrlichia chaffeensis str. Arkansas]ABD44515.1 fatty acid/phospholipid synthesis protein PlsX [Ehrlichia chaffeensis str. Arkansas]AHX03546.1 fatty acid/phospholipid synthesis protein PlsX [Ehrlichia chaffeensis str. Heartland]A
MSIISIAVDAMGGDFAPEAVVSGLDFALTNLLDDQNVSFNIYGQGSQVLPILDKYKDLKEHSVFIDTPEVVLANDKPSFALRKRRSSSMWCAIDSIKSGVTSGVVSSGNTGALMAISRFLLGTLPNIDRPAICTALPSRGEEYFVLLDLGANIESSSNALFQFAIMGSAFAKAVLNIASPKVALLNVGQEEVKGTDVIREAFLLLKQAEGRINFCGYIEPIDILGDKVDVVVTDGFCGNIVLKVAESIAYTFKSVFEKSVTSSIISKFAGLLLKSQMKKDFMRFNPKMYNGAMLLGLNGVVVKSHGNADKVAFAHAIKVTVNAVRNDINAKIIHELS